ncbi:MAG TPA: lytic transglycosylase domain-containing protein [Candidatus Sulfotelmatobacter sp.]|nr:lytic transglycosylase domain-containing protein [Candidatus Sulfotelmatobacter sp.]
MFCSKPIRVALVLALTALSASATDVAVLRNGFSIRHERRVVMGTVTRLYITTSGASYVDVPTADIEHFEEAPPEQAPVATTSEKRATNRPAAVSPTAGYQLPPSLTPKPAADLNAVVNDASGRYRLDPDLVNSVIKAESGFNARAVSPKGAQGLMQLMPGTAVELGVKNTFDPQANVDGGTRYLRELLERYNFDLIKALAAYNAGPQRVEHYGGVPPYYETRAYVARIVRDFNQKKMTQEAAAAGKRTGKTQVTNKKSPRAGSAKAVSDASVAAAK